MPKVTLQDVAELIPGLWDWTSELRLSKDKPFNHLLNRKNGINQCNLASGLHQNVVPIWRGNIYIIKRMSVGDKDGNLWTYSYTKVLSTESSPGSGRSAASGDLEGTGSLTVGFWLQAFPCKSPLSSTSRVPAQQPLKAQFGFCKSSDHTP